MEIKTPIRIVEMLGSSCFHIEDANGEIIADDGSANSEYPKVMTKETARRIVACVNSCAGVHTEQLEQMRFSLPVAYRKMRQQRDDLREELIVITNHLERIGDTRLHKDGQFIEDARAAIAKATGA